MTSDLAAEILQVENGAWLKFWKFLMRFVVPVGILAIFVSNLAAS